MSSGLTDRGCYMYGGKAERPQKSGGKPELPHRHPNHGTQSPSLILSLQIISSIHGLSYIF